MRITSSEPKYYLERSEKGLIISLGIETNIRSKKYKKARYAITNVSMKDISKIIKDFEKLPFKGYVRKRLKHKPTDGFFYLKIQLTECMTREDALNLHVDPVKQKLMASNIFRPCTFMIWTRADQKRSLKGKTLLKVCSTDKSKSQTVIGDESSTEDRKSESVHKSINTNEEKYAIDETENKETSVTDNSVINRTICFNLFKCGKIFLNSLDPT